MPRTWVALAACLWVAAARAQPLPACRLDAAKARDVEAAFAAVRERWDGGGRPALTFRTVTVNEAASPSSDRLDVLLVRDAFVDHVTADGCPDAAPHGGRLDAQSVAEVCKVMGPASIWCSADALTAIVDAEPKGRRPNPALVLLLAHELSHLVHHDATASYTEAVRPLSRAADARSKRKWMIAACSEGEADPRKLEWETRADREAIAVVERLVAADADDGAPALLLGSVEASLTGLRHWQAGLFGRRDFAPIETPGEGDDPDALGRWAAERWLCDALAAGEGTLLVPQAGGGHPLASVRLARLSAQLADMERPRRRAPLDEIGNAGELLRAMPGVLSAVDRAESEADVVRARVFCELARQPELPECATVPRAFPRARKACPEIEGRVQWESVALVEERHSVTRESGALKFDVPGATFARALPDRALLVGARGRLGFVRGDRATWFELPCSPTDAAISEEGAVVACEAPLGLVRTSLLAPVAIGRASVTFRGERDEVRSKLPWIGLLGDQTLALFRSGSGSSQTIDVTADEWGTAAPWRGEGCKTVAVGMIVAPASGGTSGVNLGHPSIHRTARFDARFERAVSFTAWSTVKPLACGLAARGPLCLLGDGRIVDPERNPPRTVARVPARELVRTGVLREAALCEAGAVLYALVETTRPDGSSRTELYQVRDGRTRRVLREDWTEEVSLRCTGAEATVTVSSGVASRVWTFPGPP